MYREPELIGQDSFFFFFNFHWCSGPMYDCMRVAYPLELKLQTIWMLGFEPGSFGKAASALNH